MEKTVLVLGASGLFGSHAARAFEEAGWTVRRYRRGSDMGAAAQGAQVIVNGLNPPKYHAWARLIPQITSQAISAARASGATLIIPGNVYVFGDQSGPWGPDTPHLPVSRKGRIRAEMEAAYADAARGGMQVITLRAGDFIAPASAGTILNMLVLKDLQKGTITSIGDPSARRAYAYLPDLARAAVALADRRAALPRFADVPFPGLAFSTLDMKRELERQTGGALKVRPFNWLLMRLMSPVWELAREFSEMRYLYETPHSLSAEVFDRLLPGFAATPFEQVVAEHLSYQGKPISTQTSRWRDAASTVARNGSSGPGQTTPAPIMASSAEGRM